MLHGLEMLTRANKRSPDGFGKSNSACMWKEGKTIHTQRLSLKFQYWSKLYLWWYWYMEFGNAQPCTADNRQQQRLHSIPAAVWWHQWFQLKSRAFINLPCSFALQVLQIKCQISSKSNQPKSVVCPCLLAQHVEQFSDLTLLSAQWHHCKV